MVDPTASEIKAMGAASDAAGEFLESVKTTDLAAWDGATWSRFIGVVCSGYVDSLLAQQAEAGAAVAKVAGHGNG